MVSSIRPAYIGLFVFAQAVEIGLVALNVRRGSKARGVPPALKGLIPRRSAERARRHAVACGRHELTRQLVGAVTTGTLLFGGVLGWLDGRLGAAGLDGAHRFLVFLGLASLLVAVIDLPFAWSRAVAVEQPLAEAPLRLGGFLAERARSLGWSALLLAPILYLAWVVLQRGGATWWLQLFAVVAALQVALQWLWPALLPTRLGHARPITGGPLPARLEALSAAAGFRTGGVYVVAASRPGHANACVVGLFRPRVLLDGQLLARLSLEEVAAVIAHEMGHFQLGHQLQRLALHLAGTFAALALVAIVLPLEPVHLAFGFDAASPQAAVALVAVAAGRLAFWVTPVCSALSRRQELAADAFAVRLFGRVGALASALQRLSEDNLANPWPHPWYAAWRYSHPPLADRLVALVRAAGTR